MEGNLRSVEKILAGDTNAFEDLVKGYQRLVNHIVFRMISDEGDREDICQDVFMKVYQNLAGFRGESKLSTWIGRIAYNRCVDYLAGKNLPLADDAFNEAVESVPDKRSAPDMNAETNDIALRLQAEIERLPAQFRIIITLYHLDEMSYAEIGRVMKLPEGTVKSYLFRSRKLLKERLLSKYRREELWQ